MLSLFKVDIFTACTKLNLHYKTANRALNMVLFWFFSDNVAHQIELLKCAGSASIFFYAKLALHLMQICPK